MKKQTLIKMLALGAAGFTLASAQATVVATEQEFDSTWAPSENTFPGIWSSSFSTTNNVLAGLTASSATGNFGNEGASSQAAMTDGIIGPIPTSGTDLSLFGTAGGGGGTQLIFDLAVPTQLTSIQYYGGWLDSGRSDVLFDVSYSTDNGVTYTKLLDPTGGTFSVVGDPGRQNLTVIGTGGHITDTTFSKWIGGSGVVSNFVIITDNAGNLGGNAVITNLKFDFYGGRNGHDGVMELAAFSAVPEPGTFALGGLSAAFFGLCVVRRRRA